MAILSLKTNTFSRSLLIGNEFYEPGNFNLIQTYTVGAGGAANVEFTSIPNTYTHLQIRVLSRNDRASVTFNNLAFYVNNDTGTNYNSHLLRGDGSSVIAAGDPNWPGIDTTIQAASGATASVMGVVVFDFLDYANTNKYKTFRGLLGVDNNGSGYVGLMSGEWRNTSAITSIKFFGSGPSNLTQYSRFSLYGISE